MKELTLTPTHSTDPYTLFFPHLLHTTLNPLLALRLLKLNGEWETYWRQKGLVTV